MVASRKAQRGSQIKKDPWDGLGWDRGEPETTKSQAKDSVASQLQEAAGGFACALCIIFRG